MLCRACRCARPPSLSILRRSPISTLFPYTTLFRSWRANGGLAHAQLDVEVALDAVDVQLADARSEEHTSELQSLRHLVCRLLLEKKNAEWCPMARSTLHQRPPAGWRLERTGRRRRC